MSVVAMVDWWAKFIRLDWPTVMFDDFLQKVRYINTLTFTCSTAVLHLSRLNLQQYLSGPVY